ncbi:hypothetical protein FQN54_001347 [Arachnomyces sp. PD_36]|nr:hypothetical protein FQN54_001347 [Arachnomyces sp. PD_36]
MEPSPGSLFHAFKAALDGRAAKSSLRKLTLHSPDSVDFSSNDFLSLSTSPAFRSLFIQQLAQNPSRPMGSGGSRLLDGNSAYAEELEQSIASFHDAPSGLLFNSGFDANMAVFSCIPQPGDVILYDQHIHASVHEGMRLSRAGKCLPFAHNSVSHLEAVLTDRLQDDPLLVAGTRNVFVAAESLYSMEGDVAPLERMVQVIESLLPRGNGYLIVDEAHSTGLFGPKGGGIVQELGLSSRIFARLHTFGKALTSHGAIVLCSPLTREYMINYARSLIYTTAMPFPTLASICAAYELMSRGETEPLRIQLRALIRHFSASLNGLLTQRPQLPSILQMRHHANSPIISLQTPYPRELASFCQEAGFAVRPIMPPTIPAGTERVRICLHAGNTISEIDRFAKVLESWVVMRQRNVPSL